MTETDFPKKIAENVTMYSADPIVYVVNDFLNDQECNSFIEAGKNKLKESTVISSDPVSYTHLTLPTNSRV